MLQPALVLRQLPALVFLGKRRTQVQPLAPLVLASVTCDKTGYTAPFWRTSWNVRDWKQRSQKTEASDVSRKVAATSVLRLSPHRIYMCIWSFFSFHTLRENVKPRFAFKQLNRE
jgi:hypothetical protein